MGPRTSPIRPLRKATATAPSPLQFPSPAGRGENGNGDRRDASNDGPHPRPLSRRERGKRQRRQARCLERRPSPPAPLPQGEGRTAMATASRAGTVVMQIFLTAGPDSRRKLRFRLVCGPSARLRHPAQLCCRCLSEGPNRVDFAKAKFRFPIRPKAHHSTSAHNCGWMSHRPRNLHNYSFHFGSNEPYSFSYVEVARKYTL